MAADAHLRLELGRDQVRAHQLSPEVFHQRETEIDAQISRLRGKWSGTLHRWTFNNAYDRALTDSVYRYQALADYDRDHGSGASFFDDNQDVILVFGGIAVLLAFGAYLKAKGWKPKEKGFSFQTPKPAEDTYGSADFAEPEPFMPDQLYVFGGVFFGKSSTPGPAHLGPFEGHQGGPICSLPGNHSIILSRTRSGKGTRVLIPTLLRYATGSALVIDPKGENAAVTARARQALGQKVHILNPWGELSPTFQSLGFQSATYNPLDILDRDDPNVVATAQALASAICPKEKSGKDAYWSDSAASVLTAVLLWLTDQPGEQKTLGRAREIVTKTRKEFTAEYLTKMAASSAFEGAIRENAAPFVDLAQETYSGVMSNLGQHTKFLSDPQIKRATATSTFSMSELMTGPTTVYVVIPPDRMDTQRTWLRLIITAGMQAYKHRTWTTANFTRCMFMIDEFPALGRLDELPRDIATMSGYGVDFVLVAQGLDQLKDTYGDARNTILSNCAYKWFCNIQDLDSAQYLSKTLGKTTVPTTSTSTSLGHNPGGGSSGASTTHGETGRDLLMPDEIINLGRDTAILLNPTKRPEYLRTVDYWNLQTAFEYLKDIEAYNHVYWGARPLQYDPNPYHKS